MDGFIACFEGLEDPRTGNAGRHDLLEILMMTLVAKWFSSGHAAF